MARPRKPTAALELAGAFQKDPKRGKARESEPVPTGKPGKAPANLEEAGIKAWDEMVREGFWLTSADKFLLEIAARYMAYFSEGGNDTKTVSLLVGVLNKLGFGPAERSKISAPAGKKKDEPKGFARFKRD